MGRTPARALVLTGLIASLLAGGTAAAEGYATGDSGESGAAVDAGDRGGDRAWRYDTYYLFPLTRHMGEAEIPLPCRIPLYPFAVAVDTVQLPFGAIAGLFGD
jgi:hypothetical protein